MKCLADKYLQGVLILTLPKLGETLPTTGIFGDRASTGVPPKAGAGGAEMDLLLR